MKMTKKKVLVAALAVCLVSILSMGTLAWFTASDEVTNNFHFTDSDNNGAADFSIDVKESSDNGVSWADDGLVFENVLPGETVDKLAVVKNTSSSDDYKQYVRVTIKVVGAPKWTTANLGVALKDSLGIDENVWDVTPTAWDDATKTNTLVLYLKDVLDKDESVDIFETVTIPEKLVNDANSPYNLTDFSISVKAEAIQSENLGSSVTDAASAFALLA